MDTWLVSGANGLLGVNAGEYLRPRVHALGLQRSGSFGPFVSGRHVDIRDERSIRTAVESIQPSVILHTAAVSRHEDCEQEPALARAVNVTGTDYLARAAADVGAKLVYISTDSVFDGRRGAYCESDVPLPFSIYGRTKLEGEEAALVVPGTLVIRTNFFGWSSSGSRSILEFFVNGLIGGNSVLGYVDFTVTSTYVEFLIEGIFDLVNHGVSGFVHLASRDALSKYEFGRIVAREFGFDEDQVTQSSAPRLGSLVRGDRNISLNVDLYERLTNSCAPTQTEGVIAAHAARERKANSLTGGTNA